MDELTGLGLVGNAAAIPIVIAITQFLKKNFSFRYKSSVVSMIVTLLVCLALFFYNTPLPELEILFGQHWVLVTRRIMDQFIIAFFTYLSASKSYDLFHGNKKRSKVVSAQLELHMTEKAQLKKEITKLKNGHGDSDENTEEDLVVSDKLRAILEG